MERDSESANSLKFVIDKVSFVKHMQILLKATSDDETPTPGYMYPVISKLTEDSGSNCSDLLAFLIGRLEKPSYHIKLKILRILRHVMENGHPEFRRNLRRHATPIRDATKFGGPPDPLHGNAPYVMVRREANELCSILFDIEDETTETDTRTTPQIPLKLGGMGSTQYGGIQGFGSQTQQKSSLVGGLKDLASRVLAPDQPQVDPNLTPQTPFSQYKPVHVDGGVPQHHQQPVQQPRKQPVERQPYRSTIKAHVSGKAGGGWEDSEDEDEDEDLVTSHIEEDTAVQTLDIECAEDTHVERDLLYSLVRSTAPYLTYKQTELFVKNCSSVNCRVIVELLNDALVQENNLCQLHSLQLVETLLRTDLVSGDEVATVCTAGLLQACTSQHTQCTTKASKVIRIVEKLCVNSHSMIEILQTMERHRTSGTENTDTFVSNFDFITRDSTPDSGCS